VSIPRDADDWQAVDTVQDFIEFLRFLAVDWDTDEAKRLRREEAGLWSGESETWAQGTPGAWMEATHAWLSNTDAIVHGLSEPSWRSFAGILSIGRRYERHTMIVSMLYPCQPTRTDHRPWATTSEVRAAVAQLMSTIGH